MFEQKEVYDEKEDSSDDEDNNMENNRRKKTRMLEMKKKTLSRAMFNNEVKNELLESGDLENTRFGPMVINGKYISFKKPDTRF